jgi:tryptophanyl-tRNA synthetase
MAPIWEAREEIVSRPERVREILQAGAEKARKIAEDTMKEVREAIWTRNAE